MVQIVTKEQLQSAVQKATTKKVAEMKKEYEAKGVKVTIKKPSSSGRSRVADPTPAKVYSRSEILSVKEGVSEAELQKRASAGDELSRLALASPGQSYDEKQIETAQRTAQVIQSQATNLEKERKRIEVGGITKKEATAFNIKVKAYQERVGASAGIFKTAQVSAQKMQMVKELTERQQRARATPSAPLIYYSQEGEITGGYLGEKFGGISKAYATKMVGAFDIERQRIQSLQAGDVLRSIGTYEAPSKLTTFGLSKAEQERLSKQIKVIEEPTAYAKERGYAIPTK